MCVSTQRNSQIHIKNRLPHLCARKILREEKITSSNEPAQKNSSQIFFTRVRVVKKRVNRVNL